MQADCEAQQAHEDGERAISVEKIDGGAWEREQRVLMSGGAESSARVRRQGSNNQQSAGGPQLTLSALLAESEVFTGAEAEKQQLQLQQRAGALTELWAWVTRAPLWASVVGLGRTTGRASAQSGLAVRRQSSASREPAPLAVAKRAVAAGLDSASPRFLRGVLRGAGNGALEGEGDAVCLKQPAHVNGMAISRRGGCAPSPAVPMSLLIVAATGGGSLPQDPGGTSSSALPQQAHQAG